MFAKVLILALAVAANALPQNIYGTRLGYGSNFGRVATLGTVGYGSGALISGVPAVGVSTYGTGIGYGLGVNKVINTGLVGAYGVGAGVGVNQAAFGLANLNIARGVSVNQAGPVNAAVQTLSRTVDYRPVPYSGEAAAVQDIDVPPQESPLRINFQSRSSPLQISQGHIAAEPGQTQVTHSEDEPQTAIHNVHRPVVQQVNEVIQPYRSLHQTVEPVIEQAHTNIAQGEGVRLTGLTSGVVGGTGVIGASGLGVTSPALVGGLGVARYGGYGLGAAKVLNSGIVGSGLYGSSVYGGYGLGGAKLLNTGIVGSGLYGSSVYGTGLGYNSGLDLSGLGGLSSYSTQIRRF